MKDVGFCWKLSPGDPLIGEFGEPSMEEREPRDPCPSSLSCCFFYFIWSWKKTIPNLSNVYFVQVYFTFSVSMEPGADFTLKKRTFQNTSVPAVSFALCLKSKKDTVIWNLLEV